MCFWLCRYFNEIAQYALHCLHLATLQPVARHAVVAARVSGRSGMTVLLSAAGGHPFMMDAEVSVRQSVVECAASTTRPAGTLVLVSCSAKPAKIILCCKQVMSAALSVLVNVTAASPELLPLLPASAVGVRDAAFESRLDALGPEASQSSVTGAVQIQDGFAAARAALRASNGLKVSELGLNLRCIPRQPCMLTEHSVV